MRSSLQSFAETQSADAFALQNSKLLKVALDGEVQAMAGSMVAYQGDISFEHAGSGGLGRLVRRAVSGEGVTLMRCRGRGDLFLADQARDVHLLYLQGEQVIVDSNHLLVFDPAGIDWNIEAFKGGRAGVGGLFNLTLQGSGWVALTSEGSPVLLDAGQAPTYADRQAVIAWAGGLRTSVHRDVKVFKALTGRHSGETFQIAFEGQGWVLVQPFEDEPVPAS